MHFIYEIAHKINFAKLSNFEVEHYMLFHYCCANKTLADYVDYFRKSNSILDKTIAEKIYRNNSTLYNFIKDVELLNENNPEDFILLYDKYKKFIDASNPEINAIYNGMKNEILVQKFDICLN
jgi:hypothetical protein